MKTKSWFVILKAETGTMLGGVNRSVSSRFATKADAEAFRDQALRVNQQAGRCVIGTIAESHLKPEIAPNGGHHHAQG